MRERCRWHGCKASTEDEIELCWYHFRLAGETFIEKRSVWGASALAERSHLREQERVEHNANLTSYDDWCRSRSVVYYVRIRDHVKIGYTIHLRERVGQLRVERPALLAAEPGWREQEATRHSQFAAERQGRREDFNPSRRLLAHIDAIHAKHGEPWAYAKRRVEAAGGQPIRRNGAECDVARFRAGDRHGAGDPLPGARLVRDQHQHRADRV